VQRLRNRIDLEQVARNDRAHAGPLVALAFDQPLILELAQGLAHRSATDTQLPREIHISQHLERLQGEIENESFQAPVDDFPRRLPVEAVNGGRQGHGATWL